MFGSYDEAVKILEGLIANFQAIEMDEDARDVAISALRAGRALILEAEKDAIVGCENYLEDEVADRRMEVLKGISSRIN